MAKSAKSSDGKTEKRKRGPFIPRVQKRLEALGKWFGGLGGKLAGTVAAPHVKATLDGLAELTTALATFEKAWTPPRGASFAVGDEVVFKKERLAELLKSGLYTEKDELDATLEVTAVSGRKIRVDEIGVFAAAWFERAPTE